ncbi:hypothetical protein KJ782_06975 [Patescibacteria group bacterium]|nr:hypothetical protein [Patescibacteria group bacterium]
MYDDCAPKLSTKERAARPVPYVGMPYFYRGFWYLLNRTATLSDAYDAWNGYVTHSRWNTVCLPGEKGAPTPPPAYRAALGKPAFVLENDTWYLDKKSTGGINAFPAPYGAGVDYRTCGGGYVVYRSSDRRTLQIPWIHDGVRCPICGDFAPDMAPAPLPMEVVPEVVEVAPAGFWKPAQPWAQHAYNDVDAIMEALTHRLTFADFDGTPPDLRDQLVRLAEHTIEVHEFIEMRCDKPKPRSGQ